MFIVNHKYVKKQHFQIGVCRDSIDLENTLLQHNSWALCFSGALLIDGIREENYTEMLSNEVEIITIINRTTGELWFKINGVN